MDLANWSSRLHRNSPQELNIRDLYIYIYIYIYIPESNGKLRLLFISGKTAALNSEFAVEDLPSAELQPWFLRLQ